ncbi:hypothetical protein LTR27_010072 [Elasticomyces elasticus]|nr:hypothetical protein LTR27_010072 [Elasticomyces elasticus]
MHYELAKDSSFQKVLSRSPFLLTAICTVAAFCSGSEDYQACSQLFQNEVSRKLFATHYDFDDVRALCIGAIWLGDLSATLNGLAVRIGTQLDLHRCITKMPHGKMACYERTRLYFLVFLCDHHCSLVHGRPPMTREWKSLKDPRAFLQSPYARAADLGLITQVELWAISRCVFEQFGADVENETVASRIEDIQRLSQSYDQWQHAWRSTLAVTSEHREHSLLVFDLYYHSAKLHLYSHIFRGPNHGAGPLDEVYATNPLAGCILDSAVAVVQCTIREGGFGMLQRLPAYFDTVIAFASVCLIRAGLRAQESDVKKRTQYQELLANLAAVLQTATDSHPLSGLAKGLEAATYTRLASEDQHMIGQPDGGIGTIDFDFDAFAGDTFDWTLLGSGVDFAYCPDEIVTPILNAQG